MEINWIIVATIVGPVLGVIVGIAIEKWLDRKPKVIGYIGHASVFTLKDQQKTVVHTHSFIVRNASKKPATNIKIGHYTLPEDFTIFPPIDHQIVELDGGVKEIQIPKLIPDEQVTISYLYFPPLVWDQISAYNKHDDGYFKIINVIPAPMYPKWAQKLIQVILGVGVLTILYFTIELGIYVVSKYSA